MVEIHFPRDIKTDLLIDYSYHENRYGFRLSDSEIRDYLAHRQVWEDFLQTGEPGCWVIESNVQLQISAKELTDIAEKFSTEENLDLFFPYERLKKESGIHLQNPNRAERRKREPFFLGYKWGNSIYFLTQKGAINLLQSKVIEDRLDNHIICKTAQDQLEVYCAQVSWLKKELDIDFTEWPERIQNMAQFVLSHCSWTEERKRKVRLLLRTLSELSQSSGIPLILQAGTHLGYVRMGGILPWDDDVDLGIEEKHVATFLELLTSYTGIKYRKILEVASNTYYYKIWLENGESIEGHDYTFPFIDLWMYNVTGNDFVFWNGMTCPHSALYPLEKIVFEGFQFQMVGNTEEVLDSRYVDWRTMIRIYPWNHRLEKVATPWYDYPMSLLNYM